MRRTWAGPWVKVVIVLRVVTSWACVIQVQVISLRGSLGCLCYLQDNKITRMSRVNVSFATHLYSYCFVPHHITATKRRPHSPCTTPHDINFSWWLFLSLANLKSSWVEIKVIIGAFWKMFSLIPGRQILKLWIGRSGCHQPKTSAIK